MALEIIKKRDGRTVSFDRSKIENAITKSCLSISIDPGKEKIVAITTAVIDDIEQKFDGKIPSVEEVQDIVEKTLAENDLFEVAKAYILYRKDREIAREAERQKNLERVEHSAINVLKRDGTLVKFNIDEIEARVKAMSHGYESIIDVRAILEDVKLGVYDKITTKEINDVITMSFRARTENDPAYSTCAARNLFNQLYKDVIGYIETDTDFGAQYKNNFRNKILQGIESKRYDERLASFDFAALTQAIEPSRDGVFAYMGAATLYERYFMRDLNQKYLELPQYFWMRIAMGLALTETNPTQKAIEFYNVMSTTRYVPSTPTLFHSGTRHPQMSSCYLNTVVDDLSHIFKSFGDNAQLSKWSGGIGTDWTSIRATGSRIKSTNVGSQGVIPFLKIADATTAAINRSGKRRGAACVYLETWHFDIEDFLELRKNTGDDRRRTHDTNTSNWIPDLFMKRVMNDEQWTLFSPDETPDLHDLYGKAFETAYINYEKKAEKGEIFLTKKIRARDLWRKMLTQLFETGHPWITFKDACNVRSPQDHCGVVHSSNLCTEITLNTSKEETAVCNLGSINLALHVKNGKIDSELIRATILSAVRMLDNVIDLNFYPTKEAEYSNMRHRPIGLGVMGLQDALYELNLNFDSHEAVDFSDEIQEYISYYAILASSELAREKGAYATYKGSKWDRNIFPIDSLNLYEAERGVPVEVNRVSRMDWNTVRENVRKYGMRNSNVMAIAPTATISNIIGVLPAIEPIYKNLYVKSNASGEFTVMNEYLVKDLKHLSLWSQEILNKIKYFDGSIQFISEIPDALKHKYKEVFEIETDWLIKHAAVRGKWIDQSQSVNIFTKIASGQRLSELYMDSWKHGLKTTYYLRTLGASSIEKATIDINNVPEKSGTAMPISEPAIPQVIPVSSIDGKKACSILDPTCESCQ